LDTGEKKLILKKIKQLIPILEPLWLQLANKHQFSRERLNRKVQQNILPNLQVKQKLK